MAHAYTPGLKVTDKLVVKKHRILPLKGDVIVKVGDEVTPNDVVARTHLPGNVVPLNVANKLGIPQEDMSEVMIIKEGDPITKDGVIAIKKSFIKWFSSDCRATIDGTLESIFSITGQVLQRGEPIPGDTRLEGDMQGPFKKRSQQHFSDRAYDLLQVVEELAAEKNCTPTQVALAWLRDSLLGGA